MRRRSPPVAVVGVGMVLEEGERDQHGSSQARGQVQSDIERRIVVGAEGGLHNVEDETGASLHGCKGELPCRYDVAPCKKALVGDGLSEELVEWGNVGRAAFAVG